MPIGAPPRQMATRNVGLNPLRTIRMASSIESRISDWAEMKTFSTAGEALGDVTNAFLRRRPRHSDTSSPRQRARARFALDRRTFEVAVPASALGRGVPP